MQSKIIKFIALLFVGLVLCATTAYGHFEGNREGVSGNGLTGCACAGRRRWTRQCCDDSNGFLQFDRCHQGFKGKFLRCCESAGQTGACFI